MLLVWFVYLVFCASVTVLCCRLNLVVGLVVGLCLVVDCLRLTLLWWFNSVGMIVLYGWFCLVLCSLVLCVIFVAALFVVGCGFTFD